MRLLAAALVCACAIVTPATSSETGALGWETYSEADSDTHVGATVVELVADEVGVGTTTGSQCQPGSSSRNAHILYRDPTGLPTFAFFSTVSWAWDCKKVTRVSQSLRPEVYQPQYTFAGYAHRNVSPAGQKTATASAQARFGICQNIAGQTCVLERVPTISWKVYANGKVTSKTTP